LVALLAVVSAPSATRCLAADLPEAITLGTSSIGGTFYVIAVGMGDLISKNTPMSVAVESVGGSDANMRAIKHGKVGFAMANSFTSGDAYFGKGTFAKEGQIDILLLAMGQPSMRQLVARADSGIRTVADLKGKRLAARRKSNADLELLADAMLKAYGMDKGDVQMIAMAKTNEQVDALESGTVHAAIIPGGAPSAPIMKLSQKTDIRFVSLPPDKMEQVLETMGPAFRDGVIPAGLYKGQEEAAHVPTLSACLVSAAGASEEAVYQVVKTLFTHPKELSAVHKAAKHWTVENTLATAHLPFHPGAIRYFREIGVWTEAHQQRQDALLAMR
jgi:TRAP transporter TAXI family solute receptor